MLFLPGELSVKESYQSQRAGENETGEPLLLGARASQGPSSVVGSVFITLTGGCFPSAPA